MAASSWDLAWACCLAVDGRSANGLGREESAVDGAGVSKPFSLGILFKKNNNENFNFCSNILTHCQVHCMQIRHFWG